MPRDRKVTGRFLWWRRSPVAATRDAFAGRLDMDAHVPERVGDGYPTALHDHALESIFPQSQLAQWIANEHRPRPPNNWGELLAFISSNPAGRAFPTYSLGWSLIYRNFSINAVVEIAVQTHHDFLLSLT